MIGMMMMTFIMFFAFVVNTGMLVNAKINLQNAADLAAYAGASVQARTLTQISYLNYEMRRQYKKFLFRYYVMGNMAQRPFPRNGGGGAGKTAALWSPDGTKNYNAPVVCMIFNRQDNFCHLPVLAQIEIPPSNALDSINTTLVEQLKKIENIRQSNCLNIGVTNTMVLRLWLWNTDPGLDNLASRLPTAGQTTVNTIRGLAFGLGLIPRELILKSRIDTLAGYVNRPAARGVTFDSVEALKGGQDPAMNERTIEAFLSAYYTLGNHAFSGDITMDEIQPDQQILLKDIKAKFDTYAINFKINGQTVATPNAGNCEPFAEADTLRAPVPLGVYKDRSLLTYYAIKLKARAKVMFSPFGDMELKAYAAAQPFGSRIGPMLEATDFTRTGVSVGLDPSPNAVLLQNFANAVPNLAIREQGDSAASGSGWDTQEAIGAYYQKFASPGGNGSIAQTLSVQDMERAYQAAMVPNPVEAWQYNIINDFGDDPYVRNFDTQQVAAFWAPVIPPAQAAEANTKIQGLLNEMFGDAGQDSAALKEALQKELSEYLQKLRKDQGENIGGSGAREGFNIARLQDPFHAAGGARELISLGEGLSESRPEKIKSSWNGVLNGADRAKGRVGYSVKFVSFDSLTRSRLKSDGQNDWSNLIAPDSEEASDLEFIQH